MTAYQPIKDSMGGGGPMPFVYTEKRAAELWAEDNKEEWTVYKVRAVTCRELNGDEGAVGEQLVKIRRDSANVMLRCRAMMKLTKDERIALCLNEDGTWMRNRLDARTAAVVRLHGKLDAVVPKAAGMVVHEMCSDGSGCMFLELWGERVAEQRDNKPFVLIGAAKDSKPDRVRTLRGLLEKLNAVLKADDEEQAA